MKLVTRKSGNHLPVTSFKIDVDYPCLDPESQITGINHPLALQNDTFCKIAAENKKGHITKLDKRYKSVDISGNVLGKVTEKQLFQENGVFDIVSANLQEGGSSKGYTEGG